jgi:hypothetical protein
VLARAGSWLTGAPVLIPNVPLRRTATSLGSRRWFYLGGVAGHGQPHGVGVDVAGEHAAHLAEEAMLIGGDRFGHGEITASRDGRTLDEHFAPMCTIENGEIVAIESNSPMWAA